MSLRPLLRTAWLVSACSLFAACSDDVVDDGPRAENACTPDAAGRALALEDVVATGPYAVGTRTLELVDTTRTTAANGEVAEKPERTLITTVWYPADGEGEDGPLVARGTFPLLVYAHGLSATPTDNTALTKLLASHGYIVVAPRFPLTALGTEGGLQTFDVVNQPGDVSFVLDEVLAPANEITSWLVEAIDPARIGLMGLSLGGLTTLLTALHPTEHDPRIQLAIAMAPPADFFTERYYQRSIPLLLISGTADALIEHETNAATAFEYAQSPVNLYTFVDATHTGFTGIASLLESVPNADVIGCTAIADVDRSGDQTGLVEAFGGAEAGIQTGLRGAFCEDTSTYAMRPSRQLLLQRAAVRSFVDAYFADDATKRDRSCHFHERVLSRANDLEFGRR